MKAREMDENVFYKELINRYKENKATSEEVEVFFHLLKEGKLDLGLANSMDEDIEAENLTEAVTPVRHFPSWLRIAAVLFFLLTGTIAFFFSVIPGQKQIVQTKMIVPWVQDLPPGGNKAVIKLADNSILVLDSVQNGKLIQQGNVQIKKLDGQLTYSSQKQSGALAQYNTLITPRGGQYRLNLPDGSKVWLNASSSIHFPIAFTGNQRLVEITGEAYFEVAPFHRKGSKIPFIIKVNDMQVQVLGTHFNIMAYDDEASIKTTLLEGAVKIIVAGNDKILKPGQQAQFKKGGRFIIKTDADTEEVTAWKNGFFQFNSADIETVMRQVERWYDVDVIYKDKKTSKHFTGMVSRSANLSQLLKILESAGVPFKIQDKKLIIE